MGDGRSKRVAQRAPPASAVGPVVSSRCSAPAAEPMKRQTWRCGSERRVLSAVFLGSVPGSSGGSGAPRHRPRRATIGAAAVCPPLGCQAPATDRDWLPKDRKGAERSKQERPLLLRVRRQPLRLDEGGDGAAAAAAHPFRRALRPAFKKLGKRWWRRRRRRRAEHHAARRCWRSDLRSVRCGASEHPKNMRLRPRRALVHGAPSYQLHEMRR